MIIAYNGYLTERRDQIYTKGYAFLSFAKSIGKNLSSNYGQKLFDATNKSVALTTVSKRAHQKATAARKKQKVLSGKERRVASLKTPIKSRRSSPTGEALKENRK